jgi:hypothetical protein
MKPTECEGVLFFEDFPSEYVKGEEISTQLGGVFQSAQLASLRDLKNEPPRPKGRSIRGPGTIRLTYVRLAGERPKGRGIYPP